MIDIANPSTPKESKKELEGEDDIETEVEIIQEDEVEEAFIEEEEKN